jgi:type III secretion protein T
MESAELLEDVMLFTLGLPRLLAILTMIPIFGHAVLPGGTRNAVAISLAMFLYPAYSAGIEVSQISALLYVAIILKEAVLGILMGFGLSRVFWAVESMGFFIDNQRGSTMASSVDPLTGSQTSPLGIFLMQVVTVYFFVSGAVFVTLLAIYESYIAMPVASFFPDLQIDSARYFLYLLDRIVALALLFAAPAMIAMFLSEFALGLISRFAPQLNVFFLSMPVKSGVGILILILYVPILLGAWEDEFSRLPEHFTVLGRILE